MKRATGTRREFHRPCLNSSVKTPYGIVSAEAKPMTGLDRNDEENLRGVVLVREHEAKETFQRTPEHERETRDEQGPHFLFNYPVDASDG